MREIKFRAWDENLKEMRTQESMGYQVWEILEWSSIVMQFTGLLDKQAKEIYEGDIVSDKILDFKTKEPEEITRTFEVYWDKETASFWQKLIEDPSRAFRSGHNFAAEKNCVVIGNIYEGLYIGGNNEKSMY